MCTILNDDPQVRLTSYGFKSRELATSLVSVIKMVITQLPGSSSSLSSSSLSSPLPSSSSYDEYQIILIILIITCQRPQDDYSSAARVSLIVIVIVSSNVFTTNTGSWVRISQGAALQFRPPIPDCCAWVGSGKVDHGHGGRATKHSLPLIVLTANIAIKLQLHSNVCKHWTFCWIYHDCGRRRKMRRGCW